MANPCAQLKALRERISSREASVTIIGMGYVGLPLACAAAANGFRVTGFDIDSERVALIARGASPIDSLPASRVAEQVQAGRLCVSSDPQILSTSDVLIICVPTPITPQREPDLSHVRGAADLIGMALRPGQLVVLESTTWPGTTDEVLRPILEAGGLRSGVDFLLAFSPEREDPGNAHFGSTNTPKVVGADDEISREAACDFYASIVQEIVPVSSSRAAEAVKLTENIFRAVNIALVNELKVVYRAMDIDIWEIIEAAKTKPFGYMPFYPGPGLGGHCIPIDPFYLTWKAREYDLPTHFVELAGEINSAMPRHVVARLSEELDRRFAKGLNGAKVLIIGAAYKKNIGDTRESPTIKLMQLIRERGAVASFHDPYVPYLIIDGSEPIENAALSADAVAVADAVLIITDHDKIDWAFLNKHARLIVDTRNVMERNGFRADHIAKA